MHQGWRVPLRRYIYTVPVSQPPEQELTIFTFPWKMLLQCKALRISHPNSSCSPSPRNESQRGRKPERSLQEKEGGLKGDTSPTAAAPASCFIFMHLQQGTQQWTVPYTILLAWNKQPFPLGPFRRDHLNRNTLHQLDKTQPPRSSLDEGARGLIYLSLSWNTPSPLLLP